MILIADSGSTKAIWKVLNNNLVQSSISTQGINPYSIDENQIEKIILDELIPKLNPNEISKIFYYGAGCSAPDKCLMIKNPLLKYFPNASIEIDHDLLAAARALCGNHSGIACILGTGSNSCSFDGKNVLKNVRALGFILGDEGSGAYMGKEFICNYLNDELPDNIKLSFEKTFSINPHIVLDKVYKQANPNRYLASFAKYIFENNTEKYFDNLIRKSLNDFFTKHILKYPKAQELPVNFVGSIAFYFQDYVDELIHQHKLKKGIIIQDPMEGLIKYHTQNYHG